MKSPRGPPGRVLRSQPTRPTGDAAAHTAAPREGGCQSVWFTWNNSCYATAAAVLRTANDSITRATPLMIMLTPTKVPIAQTELDGHWV